MAGCVPILYHFDRWDERIGILRVAGELVHTEELNGEDTLEFCCHNVHAKGDRLLWLGGNLSTAASVTVVENTVTETIDDLDELTDLDL